MRSLLVSLILLFGISALNPACSLQADENSPEAILKNVDAVQAMAIANEWKWTRKEIKSYVKSREVVFEWSEGKVKRIPLPKDKMIVAIAPYINRTHR